MNRLTKTDAAGNLYIDNSKLNAAEVLAAYEDTGLKPEESGELYLHYQAALEALEDSEMYVEAYKGKADELGDKHWDECRQIALYDDELRRAKELLQECYDALDLAEYPGLAVDIEEALDDART